MITVKTEHERIDVVKEFIRHNLEELEREIKGCDYEEDPNGDLVYSPNCYAYEKTMLESEKHKLETIMNILTREIPFMMIDL